MKKLLFLLAILLASLPLRAAEEEIYLKFTGTTTTTKVYNRVGDGDEMTEYTGVVNGKMPPLSSGAGVMKDYTLPLTDRTLQGNIGTLKYFQIKKGSQIIYSITFSTNLYSNTGGSYAFGTNQRLAIYSPNYTNLNREFAITSSNTAEYPIKQVVFGDAYNHKTAKAFTEDQLNAIEVTNGVEGTWNFSDGSLIFTPTTPQSEIKFQVVGDNAKTAYTTILRIGHLGIVRAVKSAAPKLKADNSTKFPMVIDGEFQFIGESGNVEIEAADGVTYVYTVDGTEPNATSTQTTNGIIKLSGMQVGGATKTLKIAVLEENNEIGNVREVVCRRVSVPTVTLPADTPGYADGRFSYQVAQGKIKIDRPAGVDNVFFTLDGYEPNTPQAHPLPADGIITLPTAAVGHTTQLKLVAQCGTEYGAVITIPCTRVPMSKPEIIGYTIDFTTRDQGFDTYLDGYDESSLITDFANGIVIDENHLMLRLKSSFSYDSESDGPFLEAQISDSPVADANGKWITILVPMVDHPECVVFEEREDVYTSINFGMEGNYFLTDSRKQSYLHLRASSLAKSLITGEYPTGKDLVTSEAITLHVMKAKPAAPAKPVVTMWTEQTVYTPASSSKTVTTDKLQPLTDGQPLDIHGDKLLLAFASHYDANGEPKIQYQLSDSPEADPDGTWTERLTFVQPASGTFSDLMLLQKEGNINIKDLLFPAKEGKRPTEIYLHLRAVTTNDTQAYDFVTSETATLHLTHTRPAAPAIKLLTPGSTKGTVTRFVNSAKALPEATADMAGNQRLQYAFAEATGPIWPGTEPEAWTDYNDSNSAPADIAKDGRMYARIYDSEYEQASDITVMDFELIKADRIKAEGWQGVENNSLVQLDEALKVMGCYMTRSAGSSLTAYVYLVDSDGNPLKMVVSGDESTLKKTLTDLGYFDFADDANHPDQDLVVAAGSIIARVSKTVTDDNRGLMPEILVTPTAGESYIDYLGSASWKAFAKSDAYMTSQESKVKEGGEWIEQPRTAIHVKNDFGRKVSLRSLEWTGSNNRVRTSDGMELTLYNRLDVSETGYKFDEDIQQLVAGRLYKVTGYVGQLNGELALFPISATKQCPGTPTLHAPNLIDGNPDGQGFIAVNAISAEVAFSAASDTEESVKFFYQTAATADGLRNAELKEAAEGKFTLPLNEDATCYMAVYAQLNDMMSLRPAKVAITRRKAASVASIAEFKTLEAERRADAGYDGSEKLYRLNGKAVIRMTTPYYLYVGDIADGNTTVAEPAKQYLLIYHENGWTNPQITDGTTTRSLQAGDVIENFALVGRDGMKLHGNIISNSTGFARTYKYAGEKVDPAAFSPSPIEVNYVDASSDSHYSKVALGEDQRMTYIELRNVKVKRSGSDESDYSYNLDIAGEPSLTFEVFPRTQGWHTMWKADEGFTITGVVVRDDASDGTKGYAFAPTDFKAANSLEGQLGIRFEGQGHTDDNGVQYFVQGKAVIEYTPAKGQTASTSIYYTLDGSDPRDNVKGRKHADGNKVEIDLSEDIVVRAFAAAPGLNPTAEKSMTLKNSVSDVQYILNFLRAGREGMTYRFTSKLQIVASGGDYLFVAGPVGNFLPVYNSNGWDETLYPAGSYVEHLLAVKSTDSNGNVMADASPYSTPEAIDPSEIGTSDQITVKPDEVTALTAASARRLITISNVTANAVTARAAAAPFTITTVDGSQSHPLMDGNLGNVVIKEADASGNIVDTKLGFADGEAYDITGFVMLGEDADGNDDGAVELWPVSAIHLVRTPAVGVSVQNDLTLTKTDENEYLAQFTGVAAVSISATNVRNARIYYSFDNEEWFEYFRPIAVESSCMIHAKAVAPGMAESVHTHLTLEKLTVSGDIVFAATPAPEGGKVSVALSPADTNMAGDSYKIHYTTDGTKPTTSSALYTDPFELTESSTVKAILVENGCEPGTVCTAYISVADPTPTDTPDPTVSGRVKFTLDDSDPAKVLVKIEPEGNAAPGYKIYYTTEAGKTLPEDGIEYTTPFEVTESSIVMAVLVEDGKIGGPVAEVSVWVNPGVTGIDGTPTDEADGGVRVDGNSIVAPEGSRIFDISGRQAGCNDLRRGVYIVVTADGKSVKVLVK